MKYSTKIIFGKEEINKYLNDIPFSELEKEIHTKEYHFDSKEELDAFVKGINESVGWNEVYQIPNN